MEMTTTAPDRVLEKRVRDRVMRIVRDDITDMEVDAFVYDITEDVKLGSGHGSAIQQRGGVKVQEALDAIGGCPVGEAVMTTGGLLKAKHIIHANGPKFCEPDEEGKLRRAIQAALRLADENALTTLAFPPMGTGLYQVPVELCARVMVDAVSEHLAGRTSLREVLFVIPDSRERGAFEARMQEGA
jgi:O-acetyl-ADP-ribose deacetylase (regulator of RNase III)